MSDFDFSVPDNPVEFKIQNNVLRFRNNQPMMVFTSPSTEITFELGFGWVDRGTIIQLPGGGIAGEILIKQSEIDGDAEWFPELENKEDILGNPDTDFQMLVSTQAGIRSWVSHGGVAGLDADDHPQYLNQARADALYTFLGHIHNSSDGSEQITYSDILNTPPEETFNHVDLIDRNLPDSHPIEAITGLLSQLTGLDQTLLDHLENLNNPHTLSHIQIVDIDPNQHHAQNHIHDGTDGSGTISHTVITEKDGVSCHPITSITGLATEQIRQDQDLINHTALPNAHHNQIHNLYGTDHSDINVAIALAQGMGLFWDAVKGKFQLEYRAEMLTYVDDGRTYYPQQTVLVNGYLSVAQVETTDYPVPILEGIAELLYKGAAPEAAATVKTITFGTRYHLNEAFSFDLYRVNVISGNHYTVYYIEDPLGTPIVTQIIDFIADTTGWIEFSRAPKIFPAGIVNDIVVTVGEPAQTPTVWAGNWDYSKPNNVTIPLTGQVTHSAKELDALYISKIDNIGGDRSAELLALETGDRIKLGSIEWSISVILDLGTYLNLVIAPATQAAVVGDQEFSFETVTATPITRMQDIDYWTNNYPGQVEGLYIENGAYENIVPDGHAYGLDIRLQRISQSPDWNLFGQTDSQVQEAGVSIAQMSEVESSSMHFKGDWLTGPSKYNDVVKYNSQSWICLADTLDPPSIASVAWEKL